MNIMLSITKCFPGGKVLYYRHICLRGRENRRTEIFSNISDSQEGKSKGCKSLLEHRGRNEVNERGRGRD